MKKTRTEVSELVKQIENELSGREGQLSQRENELQELQNRLAKEFSDLETDRNALIAEKADFDRLSSEVNVKMNKIRNDQKLSEDLRAQAQQAKDIEKMLAEVKEERGLTEYNLREIEKRERAVGVREQTYKEEIAKEFATKYLKI
jgi:predicted  nucleic acid-binding Zn-ribbon protein